MQIVSPGQFAWNINICLEKIRKISSVFSTAELVQSVVKDNLVQCIPFYFQDEID